MKMKFLFAVFIFLSAKVIAQCDVTERMMADGTMYYHGELLLFYKTSEFQLSGNIVTDKENFFLRLRPFPFPEKPKGTKLKDALVVKLANDTTYILKAYDMRYTDRDTGFTMIYIFDKKDIEPFVRNEVVEVKLNLGAEPKAYVFRLHKDAIRTQINCFTQKKNNL